MLPHGQVEGESTAELRSPAISAGRALFPAKLTVRMSRSDDQSMPDPLPTPVTDTPAVSAATPQRHSVGENWRGSFWALIITQFQGAFSANVLRYLLSFMVLGMALNDARRNTLVSL